uniref:MATH domain-containing protein n=1 Tax=Anisakis simplex TaxID=6269 RepID=A0A0M3JKH2_ANISI
LEFYLDDEEEASALFGNDNSKPIQKEKGDPKPPKINADKMIYYFGFNFNSRRLRDVKFNIDIVGIAA